MSVPDDNAATGAHYWYWPLLRAIPAIAIAAVITFSADHSPALGSALFGAFALVSGVVVVLSGLSALEAGVARIITVAQGAAGVVAGIIALATMGAGLPVFLVLLSGWAAATGFLELYNGLRGRGRVASARDWLFVGGLTAVLAVAVVLVPADFSQVVKTGEHGEQGLLTASVIVVGALGAYAAIVGVYLVIAALSLKWATQPTPVTAESN